MLINCVAYQDGKKVVDIATKDISDYVNRPECFVWVALSDPAPEELVKMQEEFGLHALAVEDAHHGHQRPKIEEYGDSLFCVLHSVQNKGEELNVGEVAIFVGPNYVLSVRSHTEQGFASVRARCEREPHLLKHGSGFVLYALMDTVVDRYFPVVDALEDELERIEERIFEGNAPRGNIEALYTNKRKLTVLKHAVEPLLEATGKLHGGRVPKVCADTQDYFRDVYDHLVRINQSIDALRDLVITAISVNLSLIALHENETTKRLAAYAALLMVPTLIAGIYGMNFQHMPELKWTFGYPFSLVAMVGIDLYLYFRFRKTGWL
ncbi:MAG: magnesium and cobalt transport protein CorA [Betaproteobacteria bacterium RBG_16_64_18]|nr:MAG: magnesium and cobalt transport protein CorA [Betaproteobacteria bacterium RBG_16_64_18]